MERKDDNYYIKKIKNGEVNYFSFLVEKYKNIVFSIALKVLKDSQHAEEIAQESFIKAYKSIGTFKNRAKFSTWLYRITYNTCISELRKKKYDFLQIDDIQIEDESIDVNFGGIVEERREKVVKEAIGKLPEDEYSLILFYYYEDQTIKDISKITGLKESNVKVKLFRARKKIYKFLNDLLKEEVYSIL